VRAEYEGATQHIQRHDQAGRWFQHRGRLRVWIPTRSFQQQWLRQLQRAGPVPRLPRRRSQGMVQTAGPSNPAIVEPQRAMDRGSRCSIACWAAASHSGPHHRQPEPDPAGEALAIQAASGGTSTQLISQYTATRYHIDRLRHQQLRDKTPATIPTCRATDLRQRLQLRRLAVLAWQQLRYAPETSSTWCPGAPTAGGWNSAPRARSTDLTVRWGVTEITFRSTNTIIPTPSWAANAEASGPTGRRLGFGLVGLVSATHRRDVKW